MAAVCCLSQRHLPGGHPAGRGRALSGNTSPRGLPLGLGAQGTFPLACLWAHLSPSTPPVGGLLRCPSSLPLPVVVSPLVSGLRPPACPLRLPPCACVAKTACGWGGRAGWLAGGTGLLCLFPTPGRAWPGALLWLQFPGLLCWKGVAVCPLGGPALLECGWGAPPEQPLLCSLLRPGLRLGVFLPERPEALLLQLVWQRQALPLPRAGGHRPAALAPAGVQGKWPRVWQDPGHHVRVPVPQPLPQPLPAWAEASGLFPGRATPSSSWLGRDPGPWGRCTTSCSLAVTSVTGHRPSSTLWARSSLPT